MVSIILQTMKDSVPIKLEVVLDSLGIEEAARGTVEIANLPNGSRVGFSRIDVSRNGTSCSDRNRASRDSKLGLVH